MAWTTTLTSRLRYYLGDIALPQKYSDDDLAIYIAIGAIQAQMMCSLGVDFTIDTDDPSIDPDPTDSDIDSGIGNLFVLFAAVILTRSEIRKDVSKYGIKIRDDLTQYDGSVALEFRGETLKAFDLALQDACWNWTVNNRPAVRAIFGGGVGIDNRWCDNQISILEDPEGKD